MKFCFQEIAREAFKFLESEYSFECVESGSWHVRYESDTVFVSIHFEGMRSYELGCSIGRLDDMNGSRKVPFDVGEIFRCEIGSGEVPQSGFQVTSNDALKRASVSLAESLWRYGGKFLKGDNEAFRKVSGLRNRECNDYEIKNRIRYARDATNEAWRSGNYYKVVELLSPIQEWLEPSEVKKLEYARKKTS